MVRVPPVMPPLPETAELFVYHEPFGSIFDTLSEATSHLAGFRFLRALPLVISPFVPEKGANVVDNTESIAVPFDSSSVARYLIVAVGYSAVVLDGYVKVSLKEQHTTIPGNGALVEPGCYFKRNNNDLINPIVRRRYSPTGLRWAVTSVQIPATPNAIDPPSEQPRMLSVAPLTNYDILLEWDKVKLNAVLVMEAWQPDIKA